MSNKKIKLIKDAVKKILDADIEAAFKKDYDEKMLSAVRIAFFTGLILYALFGILDYYLTTFSFYKVLFIRLVIICPLIVIAYFLTYKKFIQTHLQPFLFICSLMSYGGILGMIYILNPAETAFYYYYTGLFPVILWTFSLSRLRLKFAALSTLIMLIIYNIIIIVYHHYLSYGTGSRLFQVFLVSNYVLIGSSLIGLMVGVTVEYYLKKGFIQSKKLEDAHQEIISEIGERIKNEEKIKSLLKEKEFILKEVHHRIKNNMSTIISLLEMQAASIEDLKASASVKDAGNRVRSMMVLYDKLYTSNDFNDISVRNYLSSLIDEIVMNFPGSRYVKVEKNIDDIVIDTRSLSLLGIMINEIITNMMKYAFNGRTDGLITISASAKDDYVTFIIRDNGVGMPESVNLENSTGFGLTLIDMLADQLGGTINIESGNGTAFILKFRNHSAVKD